MTEKKTVRKPRKIRHRELWNISGSTRGCLFCTWFSGALVILVLIAQLLDRNYETYSLAL